jgi:hypothetical protein
MTSKHVGDEDLKWSCCRCGQAMQPGPVQLSYMGNSFTLELPRCPTCGLILIPEGLATGRMAEVERILEDK